MSYIISETTSWMTYGFLILIFVGMFAMTIIPQKKRSKQVNQMLSSLEPGDKIKTIGMLCGTIDSVNSDNTLNIDIGTIGKPVIIIVDKQAIYMNLSKMPAQQPAKKSAAGRDEPKSENKNDSI